MSCCRLPSLLAAFSSAHKLYSVVLSRVLGVFFISYSLTADFVTETGEIKPWVFLCLQPFVNAIYVSKNLVTFQHKGKNSDLKTPLLNFFNLK